MRKRAQRDQVTSKNTAESDSIPSPLAPNFHHTLLLLSCLLSELWGQKTKGKVALKMQLTEHQNVLEYVQNKSRSLAQYSARPFVYLERFLSHLLPLPPRSQRTICSFLWGSLPSLAYSPSGMPFPFCVQKIDKPTNTATYPLSPSSNAIFSVKPSVLFFFLKFFSLPP